MEESGTWYSLNNIDIKSIKDDIKSINDNMKEIVKLIEETTKINESLKEELSCYRKLKHELQIQLMETKAINERERNMYIRAGIPIPFRFSYQKNVLDSGCIYNNLFTSNRKNE